MSSRWDGEVTRSSSVLNHLQPLLRVSSRDSQTWDVCVGPLQWWDWERDPPRLSGSSVTKVSAILCRRCPLIRILESSSPVPSRYSENETLYQSRLWKPLPVSVGYVRTRPSPRRLVFFPLFYQRKTDPSCPLFHFQCTFQHRKRVYTPTTYGCRDKGWKDVGLFITS